MSTSLLGGKVDLRPLERRFADARGAVAIVLAGGRAAGFIEVLEWRAAGDVRGGHLHRAYTESLYVIDGSLDAELIDFAEPCGAPPAAAIALPAGSLVRISPSVAHRFRAREPTRALAFGHGSSPLEDRMPVEPSAWAVVADGEANVDRI